MEALNKILDRIIDFFSILDFSFLISGIATFTILCYGAWLYDLFVWLGDGICCTIYYIVIAYICGLVSFAFGKWVGARRKNKTHKKNESMAGKQTEFMQCFTDAINYVNKREMNDYQKLKIMTEKQDADNYYTEMWYYIRSKSDDKARLSYNLLNRYWVSQAIYDGLIFPSILSFALGICICFVAYENRPEWAYWIGILISLAAIGCGCLFYMEGKRYAEAQIREVVIVYKNLKSEL